MQVLINNLALFLWSSEMLLNWLRLEWFVKTWYFGDLLLMLQNSKTIKNYSY